MLSAISTPGAISAASLLPILIKVSCTCSITSVVSLSCFQYNAGSPINNLNASALLTKYCITISVAANLVRYSLLTTLLAFKKSASIKLLTTGWVLEVTVLPIPSLSQVFNLSSTSLLIYSFFNISLNFCLNSGVCALAFNLPSSSNNPGILLNRGNIKNLSAPLLYSLILAGLGNPWCTLILFNSGNTSTSYNLSIVSSVILASISYEAVNAAICINITVVLSELVG